MRYAKYCSIIFTLILVPYFAFSQSAQTYYKKGALAANKGEHLSAIEYFTEAYKISNDKRFLVFRGREYLQIEEYQKAITDLSKFIKSDDSFSLAYVFRASAKIELNDLIGAINDYTKAIENYSKKGPIKTKAELYLKRSQLKAESEMYSLNELKQDLDKATELENQNGDTYLKEGKLYLALGEMDIWEENLTRKGCLLLSKANELGHPRALKIIREKCSPSNSAKN